MGGRLVSLQVFGDNQGIIGAFQHGRSRNRLVNAVLKRITQFTNTHGFTINVCYVSSEGNAADGPSRGFAVPGQLLPVIAIPHELQPFIEPADTTNMPPLQTSSRLTHHQHEERDTTAYTPFEPPQNFPVAQ